MTSVVGIAADPGSGWPLTPVSGLTTAPVEGSAWSAAASGWFAYWAHFAVPAREAVARAAHVGTGSSLLDIGCGSGEFCALAASLGAQVSGIDAAGGLIAFARRRAPGADLRVGPMEQLPWPEATFDMVTGFNSFQFAADYVAALAEARRVTRSGGRVVICNWGRVEEREIWPVFETLRRASPARSSDVAHHASPIGEPGVIERLARHAGLRPETAAHVAVPYQFADRATLERALLAFIPAYRIEPADAEQIVHAAVHGPAERFRRPDGSYRFENLFRYVITRAD